MPRRSRIYIDGVPLHIVQRGHNREPCFFSDDDCHAYLHWLDEALAACRCTLHGYVRMTNHVHLLLTPAEARLVPRLLISLGRRYVQYINRSDRRTGTLWDSRYKSSLVQEDAYLLACQRYIELNPVRARMVSDPAQHRLSSYRANALGHAEARVSPLPVYRALGASDEARRAAYRKLFDAHIDQPAITDIRLALSQNQPLGSAAFYARIEQLTGWRPRADGVTVPA